MMLIDRMERFDRIMDRMVDRWWTWWTDCRFKAPIQGMMLDNPMLLWILAMSTVLGFGIGIGIAIGMGMVTIGSPRLIGHFIFALYWLVNILILQLIGLLLLLCIPSFLLLLLHNDLQFLLPVLHSLGLSPLPQASSSLLHLTDLLSLTWLFTLNTRAETWLEVRSWIAMHAFQI